LETAATGLHRPNALPIIQAITEAEEDYHLNSHYMASAFRGAD